jgi:hypothetical protein
MPSRLVVSPLARTAMLPPFRFQATYKRSSKCWKRRLVMFSPRVLGPPRQLPNPIERAGRTQNYIAGGYAGCEDAIPL